MTVSNRISYGKTVIHDEFMIWKRFPHHWPFCDGNPHVTCGLLSHRVSDVEQQWVWLLYLTSCWTKKFRWPWFETAWRSSDAHLIFIIQSFDGAANIFIVLSLVFFRWYMIFAHWGPNKTVTILQTTFSNSFSCMKSGTIDSSLRWNVVYFDWIATKSLS